MTSWEEANRSAELFRLLGEALCADPAITWSTMMGAPCLRVHGRFFASLDRATHRLVVKLPTERVCALLASGRGHAFAPAGRIFSQWVAIPAVDSDGWRALLEEAQEFGRG